MVKRVNPVPSVPPTPAKQNPNPTDNISKRPADPGFKEVLEQVRGGKGTQDLPDNYKAGGIIFKQKVRAMKKKRYEDGGEVEFESKMGQNPQIDDMTRARAQDYVEEMQRPAPTEIETREAPKAKPKAKAKAEAKEEPKKSAKEQMKEAIKPPKSYEAAGGGKERAKAKIEPGTFSFSNLAKKLREKAGITSYKSGGSVSSASKRADGIAVKGKTRGRII